MSTLPTLFISHGGPDVVIDDGPATHFLKDLSSYIPKPSAIVINSAHHEAAGPAVVRDAAPEMIYDFGGFPQELYEIEYPAPGQPALADRVLNLLSGAGLAAKGVEKRGYDHGAWNPLVLAYPEADIPVVQVSVDPNADAAWHANVGRALAPLRDENVLVIGSGHITHNLREVFSVYRGGSPSPDLPGKVTAFTDWFHDRIAAGDLATAENWLAEAPFARDNHPTDEHFFPIFTAWGAAGEGARGERIHDSVNMKGVMAWDAYKFH